MYYFFLSLYIVIAKDAPTRAYGRNRAKACSHVHTPSSLPHPQDWIYVLLASPSSPVSGAGCSSPSSHESVDLAWKPLNNIFHLQFLGIGGNGVLVLIFGWQNSDWDCDLGCIDRINHSRMNSRRSLEWCTLLRHEVYYLAAPAISDNSEALNVVLLFDSSDEVRYTLDSLRRRSSRAEELSKFLALLFIVWWVPGDVRWRTFEEIGHEYLVLLLLITVREDIGALEGLRKVTEDV